MAKVEKMKKASKGTVEAAVKTKKVKGSAEAEVKLKKKKAVEEAKPSKKDKNAAKAEKASKKDKGGKAEKVSKKADKSAKTSKKDKTAKAAKPSRSSRRAAKEPTVYAPVKQKLNKTQLVEYFVEKTGLDKKQVKAMLEAMEHLIAGSVVKKGVGEFMFPGLFKVKIKKIPARKGGEKKISFGKEVITKPRPATVKVKILPMKRLKDAALA